MHRIIMIDSSFNFALNTLHMRNTKFGKYRNTYTAAPQQKRFGEVYSTCH